MGVLDNIFGKKRTMELRDDNGKIVKRTVSESQWQKWKSEGLIKELDSVNVHISSLSGNVEAVWLIGRDVEQQSVDEFADENGELYVFQTFEDSEEKWHFVKKIIWYKKQELVKRMNQGEDYQDLLDEIDDILNGRTE